MGGAIPRRARPGRILSHSVPGRALSAATQEMTLKSRKSASGPATGRQGVAKIRV